MNTVGLTSVLELRRGKLLTCLCWNSFQIQPTKFVYFSRSRLKHIQLIHHYFCGNYFHTIKYWSFWVCIKNWEIFRRVLSLVNIFGDVDGMISIKAYLKGAFGFSGFLDLAFLFVEYIWHDVQKGSGYILSSISCQIFSAYPSLNDLLDMCPNLWCNNSTSFYVPLSFLNAFLLLLPKNHVSSVHYVEDSTHLSSYFQIKLCRP